MQEADNATQRTEAHDRAEGVQEAGQNPQSGLQDAQQHEAHQVRQVTILHHGPQQAVQEQAPHIGVGYGGSTAAVPPRMNGVQILII